MLEVDVNDNEEKEAKHSRRWHDRVLGGRRERKYGQFGRCCRAPMRCQISSGSRSAFGHASRKFVHAVARNAVRELEPRYRALGTFLLATIDARREKLSETSFDIVRRSSFSNR